MNAETGERVAPAVVGRDSERQTLHDLIEGARTGQSGVCVVFGEAGIGKTALLNDAVAAAPEFRVMRVAGIESEMTVGFAALHRLLLPYQDRMRVLPAPQRIALETTFGLREGRLGDRFLVGLAILTLIADVATEQPVLLVVDDAQWVDRESFELLTFVGRRLQADRIAMLFAFRDDGDLALPEGLPALRLDSLSEASARQLVNAHALGPIADGVALRIITETGGSPLAIVELMRGLTASQLAGRDVLPETLPVGTQLKQHFEAQVHALAPEAQTIILLAAAEPTGNANLVQTAARELGVPLATQADLELGGLVTIDGSVEFRHPLIRAAAYASAAATDRRRVHQALAEAIDPDVHPDWRAWHRAAASPDADETIATELSACADVARSRGGYAAEAALRTRAADLTPDASLRGRRLLEAAHARLLSGAPEAVARLLDTAEPLLDSPAARAESLRLRATLNTGVAPAHVASLLMQAASMLEPIDPHAAREVYAEAVASVLVSQQFTVDTGPVEVAKAALAAPHIDSDHDSLLDLLLDGFASRVALGFGAAHDMLRDALDVLMRDDAPLEELDRWAMLLNHLPAELWDDRAYVLLRRLEQLDRDRGALETLRIRLTVLGHFEMWRGDLGAAERCFAEVMDIAAALGGNLAAWNLIAVELKGLQGDDDATRSMTTQILSPEMTAVGAGSLVHVARVGLVFLDVAQGRYREAFDVAWSVFESDPIPNGNRVLPDLVEASVRCGEFASARAALDRLDERASIADTPWALAVLARSRALLAGDQDAEQLYREAITLLAQTELRTDLARTHLLFGEWLRRQRRTTDARKHLRKAHDLFIEMGARAFAERARAELAATGERARRRSPETSNDLTPQEAQIARLASTGATNADIAAKLFISSATVDYHLRKVFRKLDITSRRQLTDDMLT